ncbi:MAG: hypothetical protein ACJAS9_003263 [Polaribacter sp.]
MYFLKLNKNWVIISSLNKSLLFIGLMLSGLCQAEESDAVNNQKVISDEVINVDTVSEAGISTSNENTEEQTQSLEVEQIRPLSEAFKERLKNPEDQIEEKQELLEELAEYQKVIIEEAFIELHSGAGRGFPVFHVEEKGQEIHITKKKTQWYKVLTKKGHKGWVHEDRMAKTLLSKEQRFDIANSKQRDFQKKRWEMGVLTGDFGGATTLSLYGGWNWTENIGTEISVSQALGSVSDIRYASINLTHQVFPEWRISPYFKMGAGIIQTVPFSTIIQSEDRTDEMILVGFGLKMYASRQFFMRVEYLNHTILTSRNDNDEIEEWKIGISVFF